ncbi:MAG: hypothetical protein Fues2KO_06770 [Fuerstiella sp.]
MVARNRLAASNSPEADVEFASAEAFVSQLMQTSDRELCFGRLHFRLTSDRVRRRTFNLLIEQDGRLHTFDSLVLTIANRKRVAAHLLRLANLAASSDSAAALRS